MKKSIGILFIVICMAVCLIPFVGMTFFRTDTTTENKTLAEFPSLMVDGKLNTDFTDELGEYFEDHFAFRQQLVNTDALIQSKVFDESNVDTVINGENGWLYYTATLDDYLGQNLMSERAIYNAAHNMKLMQTYVELRGGQFAVAIPANKNSLYGENMPYYDSKIVSTDSNLERLSAEFEEQGVNYVDLYSTFEAQDEVLYLMRDSHWNGKGALLAYNTILDSMGIEHDTLEDAPVTESKTEIGDLNSMVFPLTAIPEWNYYYEYNETYSYVTNTESVEDGWIITENEEGNDSSLLMFRDSFGNTLLPYFANTFSDAYFSKGVPNLLGLYMDIYSPDVVIVEKVERNINEFAEDPPVISGLGVSMPEEIAYAESEATCMVESSENDMSRLSISGVLDEPDDSLTNVYVRLSAGDSTRTVEAFLVSSEETDYGYLAYMTKDEVAEQFSGSLDAVQVEVITYTEDGLTVVYTGVQDFTGAIS